MESKTKETYIVENSLSIISRKVLQGGPPSHPNTQTFHTPQHFPRRQKGYLMAIPPTRQSPDHPNLTDCHIHQIHDGREYM